MSLPPLTLAERLTLFFAGFQMSYRVDDQGNILLTKLPSAVAVERQYRLRDSGLVDRLRTMFPQADIEVAGDTLVVRSTVEDQNEIRKIVNGENPESADTTAADVDTATVDLEQKRFRLRVVNREFQPLLNELARTLDLKLEISDDVLVDEQQLISIEVQDATIDELMKAVLKPVDLIHERNGKTLRIRPVRNTVE